MKIKLNQYFPVVLIAIGILVLSKAGLSTYKKENTSGLCKTVLVYNRIQGKWFLDCDGTCLEEGDPCTPIQSGNPIGGVIIPFSCGCYQSGPFYPCSAIVYVKKNSNWEAVLNPTPACRVPGESCNVVMTCQSIPQPTIPYEGPVIWEPCVCGI